MAPHSLNRETKVPKNSKLVLGFIIATFVIWLAFDAWLGPNGGPTESQVLAYLGRISVTIPWIFGVLCGHWFLNRRGAHYNWAWYGLPLLIALLFFDAYWAMAGYGRVWYRWGGFYLLFGLPCGSYLVPQDDPESPVP